MKHLICVLLLSAGLSATQLDTIAGTIFNAPDGSTGIVVVNRANQAPIGATPIWTTTIYYSFCVVPGNYACLNGFGTVPNSAFTGSISSSYTKADALTVYVDTSTVPGYVNQLCYSPDVNGVCTQGETGATGGVIGLTFTKTPFFADLKGTTETEVQYPNVNSVAYTNDHFSSKVQGTVVSISANAYQFNGTGMGFVSETLTNSTVKSSANVVTTTTARAKLTTPSRVLEDWLPEDALKQLRVLEGQLGTK